MDIALSEIEAVDFHCHVDLQQNPQELIASCEKNRVLTLAVTTTPKAWQQNREWTMNSRYVISAVGLHPELVGERYGEAGHMESLISDNKFVGEVGLDGSPQYRNHWNSQCDVFIRALRRSQTAGRRVISIHSRRAADETIKFIAEHTTRERVLPVLHWFSGSQAAAQKAVNMGCYFSVNAQMLKSKSGAALVRKIPLDRIITETDSPFTSEDGRVSQPRDTLRTIQKLAVEFGNDEFQMRKNVFNNTACILRFVDFDND